MNRRSLINAHRERLYALVIAVLALPTPAFAQVNGSSTDPTATVQSFKKSLDAADVTGMCKFMAESDSSGPLNPLHFEKMQSSMSELIKLWQFASFSYNDADIDDGKTPAQAVVRISISQMKQEVRFSLLNFGTAWYIIDIEIYFK